MDEATTMSFVPVIKKIGVESPPASSALLAPAMESTHTIRLSFCAAFTALRPPCECPTAPILEVSTF